MISIIGFVLDEVAFRNPLLIHIPSKVLLRGDI